MTDLEVFSYNGAEVRSVENADGQPRFVVADVARLLGYRDAATASRLLRDHHQGYADVRTPGGPQRMIVCTEQGFYRLILRSSASNAEAIQDWVTDDVLPAISRTGSYSREPAVVTELPSMKQLAQMVIESETKRELAEAKVLELEPSAVAWDHLASTTGDYSMNEAAKVISRDPQITVGEKRLWNLLFEWRWIYRDGALDPRPFQTHVDNGRLACRARSHHHPRTGEQVIDAPQIRVTVKGLADIRTRLITRLVNPAS